MAVPVPVLIARAQHVLADVGFQVAADGQHPDWEQKLDAIWELIEQIQAGLK